MRIDRGLGSLSPPEGGTVLTVGTFDGVHEGHRALIARTLEGASRRSSLSAVLTWDRHPARTLRPASAPPLITTLGRKLELLAATGVDLATVLAFDRDLAEWSPERFATDVLAARMGARAVVVGQGWRFGHGAKGDVELLARLGSSLGFEVEVMPLAQLKGGVASSSRIRAAIADGDVEFAATLLGRPFDLDGIVGPGERRGATLGYPTANLTVATEVLIPPRGIYAGRASFEDRSYGAAISVGVNPTFGGAVGRTPTRIEAFVLDFEGDLYGRMLRLQFLKRLREERAYGSTEELVLQMDRDVAATRALTC